MNIRYFGHSYLLLSGRDYSITLDPYSNVGVKEPRVKSDYLFCSHEHFDHANRSVVEYKKEIKNNTDNFTIINTFHDDKNGLLRGKNNVLLFKLDGYSFCFLGDIGENLVQNKLKDLVGVDCLFIPIGGHYTIDFDEVFKYIDYIKPKTIIPIHYSLPGFTVDIEKPNRFLSNFSNILSKQSGFEYDDTCFNKVLYIEEERV